MKDPLKDYNGIGLVQDHQAKTASSALCDARAALDDLAQMHGQLEESGQKFSDMADQIQSMLGSLAHRQKAGNLLQMDIDVDSFYFALSEKSINPEQPTMRPITRVQTIDLGEDDEDFLRNVSAYAGQFRVDMSKSAFMAVLSEDERQNVARQIDDEFTNKGAQCDCYDYMIAGTCGLIGGLVDAFFVGIPGESHLSTATDGMVDSVVEKIAAFFGWKGENTKGSAGAIKFLEDKFKVNYDQQYGAAAGHLLGMSTRNHHVKMY